MEGKKIARKTFLRTLGGAALGVGLFSWLREKVQLVKPLSGGAASNRSRLQVRTDARAVSRNDWDQSA